MTTKTRSQLLFLCDVYLFVLTLALLLALVGCGAPPLEPVPDVPRLPAGKLGAHTYVTETAGRCDWFPRELHTWVDVNDDHQLVSPLPASVSCSTTYADGGASVRCNGLGAVLEADGKLWRNAEVLRGKGEARGDIAGCQRIAFTFVVQVENGTP